MNDNTTGKLKGWERSTDERGKGINVENLYYKLSAKFSTGTILIYTDIYRLDKCRFIRQTKCYIVDRHQEIGKLQGGLVFG
jgi:hypothetical protein